MPDDKGMEIVAVVDDDDDDAVVEPAKADREELVADPGAEAEEEESVLELAAEERLETLSIRPTPKQANEFVCASCHLVKHLSQLAHRKKQLCRDCV